MPQSCPYTYYACPCTDISVPPDDILNRPPDNINDDEQTFNPHSLRAKYTLYPIDYLLFCNDCHEIRCPRCWYEETLYHYCPNCLFETSKSAVQNETNRCTRSCYQCPMCLSTLALNSVSKQRAAEASSEVTAPREGPFILACPYCSWSTLEIGVQFDKSTNISSQLAKTKNRGDDGDVTLRNSSNDDRDIGLMEIPGRFASLASFYKTQLGATGAGGTGAGVGSSQTFGLDSPSLSRLLTSYTGGLKKPKGKPALMREAQSSPEGLLSESFEEENNLIARMQELGWSGTSSVSQRTHQVNEARLVHSMRPVATQLRSKRARRCRTCRHQLAKPEEKRHSTRFKIRLVASNHIPYITIRALEPSLFNYDALLLGKPMQFLLTFRNALFDPVKITLATPRITPGRILNKVTILCPQFEVGASTDVWDEALESSSKKEAMETSAISRQQAEAGKVWDRGRNWTSVICEVVPGDLEDTNSGDNRKGGNNEPMEEDNLLEIPVFVRMEYETEDASVDTGSPKSGRDKKVQKEVTFWCIVGAGKISKA